VSATQFGELLRRHRLAAGLTQRDLGRRAGLSLNAISLLERGERQRPYLHTLTVLADALDLQTATRTTFLAAAGADGLPLTYSVDRLSAGDRTLLCRVSIFAGGCPALAAQRVCEDREAPAPVLPRLAALTAAGLLQATGCDSEMRFSMPTPIRELASIRLAESGESGWVEHRHTLWCLDVAGAAEAAADRYDTAELVRCRAEVDNLCSAIMRSLPLADGDEVALPLSAAVGLLLGLHGGELAAAMTWLRRALALKSRAATMPARAAVLARVSEVAFRLRDFRTAVSTATQAVRIQREVGPRERLPETIDSLGHALWAHTNPAAGLPLFREEIDLARASGDQFVLARGLRSAAAAVWRLSGPRAAASLFRESLDVSRRVGDTAHEVLALSGLGCTMAEAGDCAGGRDLLVESVEKARPLGMPSLTTRTLVRLGFVELLEADRSEPARRCFEEALAIGREAAPMWRRHAMAGLAVIALAGGNEREAARAMTEIGQVEAGSMEWDPHVRLVLAPWTGRLNALLEA
jgi:transcriptional regulator with XRE-family HTH domain/tetratricopeptide (TPR) repeat protein